MHVDGEGYLLSEACRVEVAACDQICMNINKVKTQTSKYLGDILHVLRQAVDEQLITGDQQRALYEQFVRSL